MRAYERFLNYVVVNTRSDEDSPTYPSSACQFDLAGVLVEEMKAMGVADAHVDEFCYVYGTIPATPGCEDKPALGLIAHMDTSPECPGEGVKPILHENYDGGDVALPDGTVLSLHKFPFLAGLKGETLITTDGTTLLGADDKAGIAEILTAAQRLLHGGQRHATLKIGFTPDEEVGRGADNFDLEHFGADYAYTSDGGTMGEIEYENFNAAGAKVTVHGRNIHPGSAKDKMVNSQLIAMEFHGLLPAAQRPEHTEGYEGFFHLCGMSGEVEETTLHYIIRDHSLEKFEEKKKLMTATGEFINRKYGKGTLDLDLRDSYYNMKEKIEPCMYVVDRAMDAMRAVGMEPKAVPIRGGTDGARLSWQGLPCPNLCTGGENYHGRFEYIPVEDMETCTEMLVKILTNF